MSKMDKRDYEKDWPGLPIGYLIISTKDYIVFLDHENDIDWKTSDAFDAKVQTPQEKKEYYLTKNEIDSAENIPTNHLEKKVIIGFKRLLGEALVRAFECDNENARKMVKLAQDYVFQRNIEQSRYMFLTSCLFTTALSLIIGVLCWTFREFLILNIGNTAFYVILSVLVGSLGALLSVILRIGKTVLDFNATKDLHYLEGLSRILAGMISAFIVALCIKVGILLPIFTKLQSTNIAMLLGGLVAGASERLAPSLISKLDGITTTDKKVTK